MLRWQEEHALEIEEAEGLSEEEVKKKLLTGVFVDEERPEYCEEYERLINRVQEKGEG
jgi:2-oxoglutarate ferredoxin oxidoreductase subunit beta